MSPASYLTAPPRVAGRIVAPDRRRGALDYDPPHARRGSGRRWRSDVLAVIGGAAFAAVRGLSTYRLSRSVGGELTTGIERVARDADEMAPKLERLADKTGHLDEALARLQTSRARLNVLLEAIAQVRAGIARLRGVVPRKG